METLQKLRNKYKKLKKESDDIYSKIRELEKKEVYSKYMEQEYIKGDIVMYDNKIHTIMDTLGVNNYELSYVEHPVHQLELSGVPITPEILEENGWNIEDVNPHDFSNIVSNGVMYRAIKDKEILFFLKGASVFTCPLNWRKIEIRYVHELQHLLFGLGLNHEIEV